MTKILMRLFTNMWAEFGEVPGGSNNLRSLCRFSVTGEKGGSGSESQPESTERTPYEKLSPLRGESHQVQPSEERQGTQTTSHSFSLAPPELFCGQKPQQAGRQRSSLM